MHLEFDVMKNFTSWEAIRNLIKTPHISEIRDHMEDIAEEAKKIGSYAEVVRQVTILHMCFIGNRIGHKF